MNNITTEDHRNPQPRLLDSDTLVVVRLRTDTIKHRACAVAHLILQVLTIPTTTNLRHLTYLLIEGHLREQSVYLLFGGVLLLATCQQQDKA